MNYEQQFRDAIKASGIEPPESVHADGVLHRFSDNGKRNNKNGWYALHSDGIPAGMFGTWRTGLNEKWRANIGRDLTQQEKNDNQAQMESMKRLRLEEKATRHKEAATRAADICKKAQPESGLHAYLQEKKVKAYGIRTNGLDLIVPMRDSSKRLHSIQTISPKGDKKFLPGGRVQGCYHSIGKPNGELCITEGYATAASIREATGKAVAVAFNAGNLMQVAKSIRAKYPDIKLILCADDDCNTEGNPGITKATEAANAVGGLLAVPDFGNDRPDNATDFNDMAAHRGLQAVSAAISKAMLRGEDVRQSTSVEITNNHDPDLMPQALAALSEFEYAKLRIVAAEFNEVRPSDLDKEVKRLRKGSEETETSQGKEIQLPEPEPWEEPVDGLELLNDISDTIKRHMSLKDSYADASTVWAAHTYLYDAFSHTPRLCITAPDVECGKTVLMSHLIGNLVTRPQIVENMSPAPFFRLAASYQPIFLIDEVDAFLKEDSDLISALNNGWEPHGCVLRCVGDDNEVRQFSTHCPVAMAGIELYNRLPPATMSRSIVIHLERAVGDEVQEEYDERIHRQNIKVLGRKLARWCQDNYEKLKSLDPVLPHGVKNRQADKWRPLMAIAQVAGGNWPSRIERAMFSQVDMSEPSKRHQLLTDMIEVMGGDIHTATLIDRLCNMEDSPWSDYNFRERDEDRRKIKPRQIALLLKGFGVHPKDVRAGGQPRKGYYFTEVKNAADRYISSAPPGERATTLQVNTSKALRKVTNATQCSGYDSDAQQTLHDVADRISRKANASMDCSVVADIPGGRGQYEGMI